MFYDHFSARSLLAKLGLTIEEDMAQNVQASWISPRFHVSENANVIHKRKRNHHQTLSVIMSSVFPCNRFN